MNQDFNPLDLSAAVRKPETVTQIETVQPEPTVNRISMGPIFHSRITKILAAGLSIILAALVGYSATSYYLNRRSTDSQAVGKAEVVTLAPETTPDDKPSEQSTAPQTTQTAPAPSAPTTSPSAAPAAQSACGVTGMPEGVCTAIQSIESTGLKGNSYVAADTSQVPADSTVQVDEKSWKATNPETSTVNFVVVLGGKTYKGVGTLQVSGGIWKVVSYTLS